MKLINLQLIATISANNALRTTRVIILAYNSCHHTSQNTCHNSRFLRNIATKQLIKELHQEKLFYK